MELMKMIFRMLQEPTSQVISMLSGFFFMVFGYFIPIREIVHVMVLFFILDVIFGFWAAKKLRKEKFSVKIIWKHTLPRMAISFVLILSAFMWDSTFDQNVIATYKIIGWFISGVLLFSIAQNGYKITKWAVFPQLLILVGRKVKDSTGLDVDVEKSNARCNGKYNNPTS